MKSEIKKYLIILSGSPRGGDETWDSLEKFVINHLNADLAICTTDNFKIENRVLIKSKYNWILKDPGNFINYYKKFFNGTWMEYLKSGRGLGLYESGMIHFALKDFLLRNYIDFIKKYEYIIFTRFDQFYTDFHPDFSEDFLYIPEGEDYFGICDRHAVFKSDLAEDYFSIVNYINSEKALLEIPKYPNCESVFKQHLNSTNLLSKVKRFDRISFTSALKNEPTNWRIPTYKVFSKNLMIKYPDEFKLAIKNSSQYRLHKLNNKNAAIYFYYIYLNFRNFLGNYFNNKTPDICDEHGYLFKSSRYKNLKSCPECGDKN